MIINKEFSCADGLTGLFDRYFKVIHNIGRTTHNQKPVFLLYWLGKWTFEVNTNNIYLSK